MLSSSFLASISSLAVLSQCAVLAPPPAAQAQVQLATDGVHAFPAPLTDMVLALDAMQKEYFDDFRATWPSAIDWTAAVLGTHLPASLKTISKTDPLPPSLDGQREALISTYFEDLQGFYTGQSWIDILFQAYDDILWVVLGWLEAATFVQEHADRWHSGQNGTIPRGWYGQKHVEAYAFRSRFFWDWAGSGWDEELCGGGMTWNPRLAPYKNAITNQLWVAASVSMYLSYPGDSLVSGMESLGGFVMQDAEQEVGTGGKEPVHKPHEKKYLDAAVKGYDWLIVSNMTNKQGLFVDGYHIQDWHSPEHPGTKKCDVRDETVYTYNQGVILTGQRGLWQSTGNTTYLEHGHQLIQAVIAATGWDLASSTSKPHLEWQGLGRLGVLEDHCDLSGDCSQDATTFKGIYFLHFNAFCKPLPVEGDSDFGFKASEALAKSHAERCGKYAAWANHNARAAVQTKDDRGLFGMWWTEKLWPASENRDSVPVEVQPPVDGADVRNMGVPNDLVWRLEPGVMGMVTDDLFDDEGTAGNLGFGTTNLNTEDVMYVTGRTAGDRHLIRSPEIQSGGVSVLRAVVELGI